MQEHSNKEDGDMLKETTREDQTLTQPGQWTSTDSTNNNNKLPNNPEHILLRQENILQQPPQPNEDVLDANNHNIPQKYPESTNLEEGMIVI